MKLLTQEIMDALPKIYATNGISLNDKIVICKFIFPFNDWKWFVFEGEPFIYEDQAGNVITDIKFFGIVHGFEKEMGYFLLSEISPWTVIDLSVFKVSYGELMKGKD